MPEVRSWGYQECLPHQAAIIDFAVAINGLEASSSSKDAATADALTCGTQLLSRPEMGMYNSLKGLLSAVKDPERKRAILQALTEME